MPTPRWARVPAFVSYRRMTRDPKIWLVTTIFTVSFWARYYRSACYCWPEVVIRIHEPGEYRRTAPLWAPHTLVPLSMCACLRVIQQHKLTKDPEILRVSTVFTVVFWARYTITSVRLSLLTSTSILISLNLVHISQQTLLKPHALFPLSTCAGLRVIL